MTSTPAAEIITYNAAYEAQLVELVRELQAHEHKLFDRMKPPADIGSWYVDALLKQCHDNDGEILLLIANGSLAGYAAVLTKAVQDAPDETSYTYAVVNDLAVTAKARGRGFGRMLLGECERRARDAGTRWLRIHVMASNESAVGLYRSFGFSDHLIELEKPLEPS